MKLVLGAIGIFVISIIIIRNVLIGRIEKGPDYLMEQWTKIKGVSRKGDEYMVSCGELSYYMIPCVLTTISYVQREEEMYLKMIFTNPSVVRKRWLRKKKIQKLPMEMRYVLYTTEIRE